MRLWSTATRWLLGSATSLTLVAVAMTGCGGGSSSGNGSGSGASSSGASGPNGKAGNSSAASGPDLNLGGDGSGGPDPSDPINTCAGELIEAKSIPLDMYVMLDVSGSMLDRTEGDPTQSKWQAVSKALSDFVSDPESAGLGMGLQVFPIRDPAAPAECTANNQCGALGPCFLKICDGYDGIAQCDTNIDCLGFGKCAPVGQCTLPDQDGYYYICQPVGASCDDLGTCDVVPGFCINETDCRVDTYATAAAPIAELPAASTDILGVISGVEPDGDTPSGPALSGAITHAQAWAAQHPDHRVVAVLATDGLPTSCEPLEIADVAQVAASGRAATPSISTFVIGVFGAEDLEAPANLNSIANAGGTNEAFMVDTQGDVTAQFRDALNQIRGAHLACELAIPAPEAGMTLDFNQVNVTFDNGSGPATLFYVEQQSACDSMTGGWYYDKLPSTGAPERIVVCPTTCDQFGQVEMGSVQIQLGCATRTPVK